jgi:hypothetical protein
LTPTIFSFVVFLAGWVSLLLLTNIGRDSEY